MVLFSGGQDSTVCLAWALERYGSVETIGFDYGQSHKVELDCREKIRTKLTDAFPQWGERLGPDHLLHLNENLLFVLLRLLDKLFLQLVRGIDRLIDHFSKSIKLVVDLL